jgi:hypothetical protein
MFYRPSAYMMELDCSPDPSEPEPRPFPGDVTWALVCLASTSACPASMSTLRRWWITAAFTCGVGSRCEPDTILSSGWANSSEPGDCVVVHVRQRVAHLGQRLPDHHARRIHEDPERGMDMLMFDTNSADAEHHFVSPSDLVPQAGRRSACFYYRFGPCAIKITMERQATRVPAHRHCCGLVAG